MELYSQRLKKRGFDPLPIYCELPETPYSSPELAEAYPLIFTSWKSDVYRHSGGRQIDSLRSSRPEPVAYLHPQTAQQLQISDGDWVYIETRRGRIRQKAKWGMKEHVELLKIKSLPVPKRNTDPKIIIQNERKLAAA